MTRIAVIGNVGGGKTTLSAVLGRILQIRVYTFDTIQWQPGWTLTKPQDITRLHNEWLRKESWIIDGFGGFDSWEWVEARLSAADTVIFIDLPLRVHYWWAIKRQCRYLRHSRPELPPDCPALPFTWRLLKRIWIIHHVRRPELIEMIRMISGRKQVIHICSPRDLKIFTSNLEGKHSRLCR